QWTGDSARVGVNCEQSRIGNRRRRRPDAPADWKTSPRYVSPGGPARRRNRDSDGRAFESNYGFGRKLKSLSGLPFSIADCAAGNYAFPVPGGGCRPAVTMVIVGGTYL